MILLIGMEIGYIYKNHQYILKQTGTIKFLLLPQ